MRKPNLKLALATLAMCFYACNSTDDLQGPTAGTKALSKVIDVTHHGHPFSTGKSMTTTTGKYVAPGQE
jgi:alpha-amylase